MIIVVGYVNKRKMSSEFKKCYGKIKVMLMFLKLSFRIIYD